MKKEDFDQLKKLENNINTFEKIKKYIQTNLFNFGLGWYNSKSFWSEKVKFQLFILN